MSFSILTLGVVAALAFESGSWFGMWVRDRIWRSKGDHEYMNRMASGGHIYNVKREDDSP